MPLGPIIWVTEHGPCHLSQNECGGGVQEAWGRQIEIRNVESRTSLEFRKGNEVRAIERESGLVIIRGGQARE